RNSCQCTPHNLRDSRAITVPDAEGPSHRALAIGTRDGRGPRAAKTMWRTEIARRRRASPLDRPDSQSNVATHIERTLELQLSVEVSVIPELMTFVRDTSYELRPALGVTSQHEESRSNSLFGESVEYQRRCVRVRSVI